MAAGVHWLSLAQNFKFGGLEAWQNRRYTLYLHADGSLRFQVWVIFRIHLAKLQSKVSLVDPSIMHPISVQRATAASCPFKTAEEDEEEIEERTQRLAATKEINMNAAVAAV